MKKKKKFELTIVCDKEITTNVIQLFKFENNIDFKKIKTGEIFTEITIKMEK